uniref:Uncharacterized protein n=1 Tax=Arundo donax TaxID=35708 RepID=A0A0A8Z254_ARUDO
MFKCTTYSKCSFYYWLSVQMRVQF